MRPRCRGADRGARRRHFARRPVLQRRAGDRYFEVPGPHPLARPLATPGPRAARRDPRSPAGTRRGAPPDLRSRSGHAQSLHPWRDDREQLLRRALGDGRRDQRQRRGAGRASLRRHAPDRRTDHSGRARADLRRRRQARRDLPAAPRAARPPRCEHSQPLPDDPEARLRLRPAAASARARLQRCPCPRRDRRDLRPGARGDGAARP